jgi:putative Holliday junction resolvase
MCLDYGDVRIGIALSDMLGIIASGLETYTRKDEDTDIEHILKLIQDNSVDTVVIGLPINMDGTSGNRVEVTKAFGAKLAENTTAKVVYLDERLSSVSAEKLLIEADVRRDKRKQVIDKLAATIILQNYLDIYSK